MARERYLLDDEEDTIHNPKVEIKADTKKSKWQNFWYYHKWHMVIGVAVCLLIGLFLHDVLSKVNPDYEIALMTQQTYPSDVVDSLQKEISKYGKDLNGDGKVIVQIDNYVLKQGDAAKGVDPNQQMANVTRFTADMQNGQSMIFLTDDVSLQNVIKMSSDEDSTASTTVSSATNTKVFGSERVAWGQCKVLSKLNITYGSSPKSEIQEIQKALSGLSITMRSYDTSDSKKKAYFDESKKLFDKLVYDK